MTRWTFWLVPALLIGVQSHAQTAGVEFLLRVSDGAGGMQELRCGLSPDATDTVDRAIGEVELPPPPPLGVFDARLVGVDIGIELGQGVARDIRQGDSTTIGTRIHELMYQSGDSIIISWDFPPTIAAKLNDVVTGSIVDTHLAGAGRYIVTNPGGISRLILTVRYALSPPAAPELLEPADSAVGVSGVPMLRWHSSESAWAYHLQVVTDTSWQPLPIVFEESSLADTSCQLPLLQPLSTYWWRVAASNAAGAGAFSAWRGFTTQEWLGVEDDAEHPDTYVLYQNYPNPFNPTTEIRYQVSGVSNVKLVVYDIVGREVATLVEGRKDPGRHEVTFDASGLASGMYFCRLRAGAWEATLKLSLVR